MRGFFLYTENPALDAGMFFKWHARPGAARGADCDSGACAGSDIFFASF